MSEEEISALLKKMGELLDRAQLELDQKDEIIAALKETVEILRETVRLKDELIEEISFSAGVDTELQKATARKRRPRGMVV